MSRSQVSEIVKFWDNLNNKCLALLAVNIKIFIYIKISIRHFMKLRECKARNLFGVKSVCSTMTSSLTCPVAL